MADDERIEDEATPEQVDETPAEGQLSEDDLDAVAGGIGSSGTDWIGEAL